MSLPDLLTRLTELEPAWKEANPGVRLGAVRRAGKKLKDRIASHGPAACVRTFDLITFPYPTAYGLGGAALSPAPYVMMTNRMHLVQVPSSGAIVNILVNPTDSDRSIAAPFFARQIERYGKLLSRRVLSHLHQSVAGALATAGVAPEDIDFITFDHMHVQDVRGLLGTTAPEPGAVSPTPALLPNARLLVHQSELSTFDCPHPLQRTWYVADGVRDVPADKIVALNGDYLVGDGGFALIRTPGHTAGNVSPVLVTDSGLWTVSENGIAVECYAPAESRIPGLRRHARQTGDEVILNANTREATLDQYTSMVLEKTLADAVADNPALPQHFPSSELTASWLAPGLAPTYCHPPITHGEVMARTPSHHAAAHAVGD
ncbi:MAG TPA: hypothetical protein VFG83_09245 [Kofleriaceae bacterium]|nr:hypothetical protein [Kofleriaceae bacterium]